MSTHLSRTRHLLTLALGESGAHAPHEVLLILLYSVGTTDVVNIIHHVTESMKADNAIFGPPDFKYVPFEGELINTRKVLGISYVYPGLPNIRLFWQSCDQYLIIPWRLSRNLDPQNKLYDLEVKAKICNPDKSPEILIQEDELAIASYLPPDPPFICNSESNSTPEKEEPLTAVYLPVDGDANCVTPCQPVHETPNGQPENNGPTDDYTSTYLAAPPSWPGRSSSSTTGDLRSRRSDQPRKQCIQPTVTPYSGIRRIRPRSRGYLSIRPGLRDAGKPGNPILCFGTKPELP